MGQFDYKLLAVAPGVAVYHPSVASLLRRRQRLNVLHRYASVRADVLRRIDERMKAVN